jgi:preprotein translocase subunit YajC
MYKMLIPHSMPSIFAEAPAPAAAPAGPGLSGFLPIILMFVAMYFLLIAPQRKKQKQHAKMLESIKAGDEILTSGGIYATVVTVRDDRFVIRVGDGTKLELAKGFVQNVENKSDSDKKTA